MPVRPTRLAADGVGRLAKSERTLRNSLDAFGAEQKQILRLRCRLRSRGWTIRPDGEHFVLIYSARINIEYPPSRRADSFLLIIPRTRRGMLASFVRKPLFGSSRAPSVGVQSITR